MPFGLFSCNSLLLGSFSWRRLRTMREIPGKFPLITQKTKQNVKVIVIARPNKNKSVGNEVGEQTAHFALLPTGWIDHYLITGEAIQRSLEPSTMAEPHHQNPATTNGDVDLLSGDDLRSPAGADEAASVEEAEDYQNPFDTASIFNDQQQPTSEPAATAYDGESNSGVYLATDGNYYDAEGNLVSSPENATAEEGFSGEYDPDGSPADGGFRGEEVQYDDDDDNNAPVDTFERPMYDLNGDPIEYADDSPQYDEQGNPIFTGEVEYDEDGNPIYTEDADYYGSAPAPPGTGYDDGYEDEVHDGYEEYHTSDDGAGEYDYSQDPYYDNYDDDVDDFDYEEEEQEQDPATMGDEDLPGVFVDDETQSLKGDDELKKKKKRRLILLRRKKKKRDAERKDQERQEDRDRRRRCCWLLLCLLCCLLLLLGIILGIIYGLQDDEDNFDDDALFFDDDFVEEPRPYQGITTTPMDPYLKDDCYFGDNIQPHVINQCECYQAIDVMANDIRELYQVIREDINEEIYDGHYNDPDTSCDPINQALYWLSSGDTRDAGDLYQRFVMALTFIKMNGTSWDLGNLWLSDDSECIW